MTLSLSFGERENDQEKKREAFIDKPAGPVVDPAACSVEPMSSS
jgi:hypothetical protein